MTATLWHIELSPYSEKARWALDLKGVPYRLRTPMPGLLTKPVALALTRGKWVRMPVLQLGGKTVPDSSAIVAALEEHTPDPPLYPGDPADRTRALEIERYFSEEVAPAVRRFGWQHMLGDADLAAGAVFGDRHPLQAKIMKSAMPVTRASLRADYGIDAEAAVRARATIVAAIERIERELDGGEYLVGDRFSVADLSAAALLTPMLSPPERPYLPARTPPAVDELVDELRARPGGEWVFEMYRRHRTPAGAPALA